MLCCRGRQLQVGASAGSRGKSLNFPRILLNVWVAVAAPASPARPFELCVDGKSFHGRKLDFRRSLRPSSRWSLLHSHGHASATICPHMYALLPSACCGNQAGGGRSTKSRTETATSHERTTHEHAGRSPAAANERVGTIWWDHRRNTWRGRRRFKRRDETMTPA